jgi:hypothetical protein
VITLGDQGGAGHLIICEVVRMHVAHDVLGERNRIDPQKMDLMGRMGRAYYVRCSGQAIHTIVQDFLPVSIGYDQLPEHIRNSSILTGNDLGKLAGLKTFPSADLILEIETSPEVKNVLTQQNAKMALHYLAKQHIDRGEVEKGFSILMMESVN